MSETILIAGGGTMGAGIAAVAAAAGYSVDLVEPNAATRARIVPVDGVRLLDAIPETSDAIIAIEAVPEDLGLKRTAFAAFERALGPDAIIATNTSSLSVEAIASDLTNPDRAIGLHFFNPPQKMVLVEIICTEASSDAALDRATAFVAKIGKTSVLALDTPGFIVNRIARPYYLQAMRALELGVAPVEDLDALARGIGFKMGPFELMDLIGLDVNLATSESIYKRTGSPQLEPAQIQREMVAKGELGRKSGVGFYDYADGKPHHDDAPLPPLEPNADEVVVLTGYGPLADELLECLQAAYTNVTWIGNDDLLDTIPEETTIVFDAGDGTHDRGDVLRSIAGLTPADVVIFADAYGTDVAKAVKGLRSPERLVAYGILDAFATQQVIEIVDDERVTDDAFELAQELFEAIGRRTVLVEPNAGLFLGRVVGSIINEAVGAVEEGIASADDIDVAMRLGTNYPVGPIAWGREIGGRRIAQILKRVAAEDDAVYAPHRALWVLDLEEEPVAPESPLQGYA